MKARRIAPALLALALAACSQADTHEIALVNPGFEQPLGERGAIPGWIKVQHTGPISYEMTTDTKVRAEGAASFRIVRQREQVYGSIWQRAPAAGLAGKTVELSAMMKAESVGAKGWRLQLRTLPVAAEDNMVVAGTLSGTQGFTRVSAKLRVPPDATEFEIVASLRDGGNGWLDDVHLRLVEP